MSPLPFRDFIERMDKAAVKAEYQRAAHDLAGFIQGHHQEIEKRYDAYQKLVEAMQANGALADELKNYLPDLAGQVRMPVELLKRVIEALETGELK